MSNAINLKQVNIEIVDSNIIDCLVKFTTPPPVKEATYMGN